MDTVFVKRMTGYQEAAVAAAVDEILAGCGVSPALIGGRRVLLKPNLLMRASPEEAVTTHPAVLMAVAAALKKMGAGSIVAADSPGGNYSRGRLRAVYQRCGLLPLAGIGVSLNEETGSRETAVGGRRIKRLDIIDPVLDAEVVVSVGKLKTHAMCGMTGAVKNLFGVVPGLMKADLHMRFPEKDDFCDMLIDLAEWLRPSVSIVDGVVGMEGNGPSGGSPRGYGLIAGSRNPYFLDRVLARYIGMRTDEAMTVKHSVRRGLAPEDAGEIPVAGDVLLLQKPLLDLKKPKSAPVDFSGRLPRLLRKPAKAVLESLGAAPVIRRRNCTGCGRCREICPARAIGIQNRTAVIGDGCIRCFCCHEVCPARAIGIKRNFLRGDG